MEVPSSAPARVIVVGGGAIGAPIAGMLQGPEVIVVARGAHGEALARDGLDWRRPSGPARVPLRVAASLADVKPRPSDLLVLSVMGQDTEAALRDAPREIAVVSLQNGDGPLDAIVALGHPLLAGLVYVPAERRGPGVIAWYGSPLPGAVLLGGWGGANAFPSAWCDWLVAALSAGGLLAKRVEPIAPWIRAKLLINLGGIVGALCDTPAPAVVAAARAEAEAVWRAAGLRYESVASLLEVVGGVGAAEVDGRPRVGSSTRHALGRGHALETASLHGPLVRLGAQLGVPTPVNEALIALAERAAAEGWRPGSLDLGALLATTGVLTLLDETK
ncbi:MAG: hypothetical protein KC731_15310 [Myxococcales bacterium]|nr:hypothetical protein [Myxococcales bacterium]